MSKKALSITPEMMEVYQYLHKNGQKSIDELADQLDIPRGKVELVTHQLNSIKLVERKEHLVSRFELTNEGRQIVQDGLPENIILFTLSKFPKGINFKDLNENLSISRQAINAAIGQLRKEGVINIQKGLITLVGSAKKINTELEVTLRKINDNPYSSVDSSDIILTLTQRGFVEQRERQETTVKLTKLGEDSINSLEVKKIVSKLTPEQLRSGEWRSLNLKKYKITSQPKFLPIGKKHPYLSFLEEVKLKLVGLGFAEMRGPLVEIEFWNFDALFQAQDHPAREWSDAYISKNPTHGILPKDKKLVDAVKLVHETGEPVNSRGWRYKWDPKKAAQLILRPQGTAVSARTLYNLEIPSKYFSIARCYRPDSVDATHLSEFNQLEGIVCDPSITFRDLLGILKTFAIEIAGAKEVRFKPDYYPFTSPSVELSALHPELGYIEFGGAGIFRPEVTAPFGISDPVIAWGLGIDRLFMVKRHINDIRDLFTHKLEWLRDVPMV